MSEANDVVQKEHFAIISKKNSVVPKSKGDNATVMARNNPPSWGLKIPGRPPTPSEGYAQQYDRIGPVETQRLWTFDNGTCLRYGPDDLIDEFDPVDHPFCNQVALIDTMIRDIVAVRTRYEVSGTQKENAGSDDIGFEEDPFNNFRQRALDPSQVTQVSVGSCVYNQVPSRFASIGNLVSVYTLPNKSDVPGECHRGLSNDTRFGMSGKPSFGAQQIREQQNAQREDNIHRSAMQRLVQGTGQQTSGRGRRGRGRQLGQHSGRESTTRLESGSHRSSARGYASTGPGLLRRGRGGTRGGKRHASLHGHQRFKSQGYSVAGTPLPDFAFPAVRMGHVMDDYEDEGPLPETPQHQRWINRTIEEGTTEDDQMTQVDFDPFQSREEGPRTGSAVRGNTVAQKFASPSAMDMNRYPLEASIYHPHSVPIVAQVIPAISLLGFPPPSPPSSFDPIQHLGVAIGNENRMDSGMGHMLYGLAQPPMPEEHVELAVGAHKFLKNGQYSTSEENVDPFATMHAERRAALERRFNSATVDSTSAMPLQLTTTARRLRPDLVSWESHTCSASPFVDEGGRLSAPP